MRLSSTYELTRFIFSLNRPAALVLNGLINLIHQKDGLSQRCYNSLIMLDVFVRQNPLLAVFQPFVTNLIAADMEAPHFRRHAFKILSLIDIHTSRLVFHFAI